MSENTTPGEDRAFYTSTKDIAEDLIRDGLSYLIYYCKITVTMLSIVDYISPIGILGRERYNAVIHVSRPNVNSTNVKLFTKWCSFSRDESQPVFLSTYPVPILRAIIVGYRIAYPLVRL